MSDESKSGTSSSAFAELGVTSAPLKSAAFFIGAYCKDYNGASSTLVELLGHELMACSILQRTLCSAKMRTETLGTA